MKKGEFWRFLIVMEISTSLEKGLEIPLKTIDRNEQMI